MPDSPDPRAVFSTTSGDALELNSGPQLSGCHPECEAWRDEAALLREPLDRLQEWTKAWPKAAQKREGYDPMPYVQAQVEVGKILDAYLRNAGPALNECSGPHKSREEA